MGGKEKVEGDEERGKRREKEKGKKKENTTVVKIQGRSQITQEASSLWAFLVISLKPKIPIKPARMQSPCSKPNFITQGGMSPHERTWPHKSKENLASN